MIKYLHDKVTETNVYHYRYFVCDCIQYGSIYKYRKNVEPDKLIVQYKTLQDTKIPESMNDVSIVYFTDLQYGKFENKKERISSLIKSNI